MGSVRSANRAMALALGKNVLASAGGIAGIGDTLSVAVLQVHVQRLRMQSLRDVFLEQPRQGFATAHRQCLGGQILQDLLRVIGTAEEGAIEARAYPSMNLGRARDHEHTKGCANGNCGLRTRGKMTSECLPEPECKADRNRQDEKDKSALHDEVPRAAFEQHGNVHDAMLHHRVGEGERKEKQQEHTYKSQPEGNALVKEVLSRRHGDDRRGLPLPYPRE